MDNAAPRIRVAAIITDEQGRVLAVRHVKGEDTYWLLPGGGVEYGESLAESLVRELREETGLEVKPGRIAFVNDSIPPGGHRHVVNIYFMAEVCAGRLNLGTEANLAELRYMSPDELAAVKFYPDVREAIMPLLWARQTAAVCGAPYLGSIWT